MATLSEKAKLAVCNSCGLHVMAGKSMATLKPVVLDLVPLDVPAFLAVRAAKRKVYAIGTCGEIVGPLSSRDTYFPMNAWRPEHPCPWTQPEDAARGGSTRPLCETGEVPGAAPPAWCLRTPQERAGGATGCESCSPCPFDSVDGPGVPPVGSLPSGEIRQVQESDQGSTEESDASASAKSGRDGLVPDGPGGFSQMGGAQVLPEQFGVCANILARQGNSSSQGPNGNSSRLGILRSSGPYRQGHSEQLPFEPSSSDSVGVESQQEMPSIPLGGLHKAQPVGQVRSTLPAARGEGVERVRNASGGGGIQGPSPSLPTLTESELLLIRELGATIVQRIKHSSTWM